jgi:ATP/ADP translocase
MEGGMNAQLLQLLPTFIVGAIYAAVVFVMARKRNLNPWGWTIGALIPVVGIFVSAVFMLLTFLSVLDRLNALEGRATSGDEV